MNLYVSVVRMTWKNLMLPNQFVMDGIWNRIPELLKRNGKGRFFVMV